MNKETIELVKKMVEDGSLPQEVAIKYCPELEENKDEKIRKELIRAFQSLNTLEVWNGIKRSDILAYLKKMGKQEWTEEDKSYFKKISLILSKELPADEFHDVMAWFEHLKSTDEEPDILKGATLDNNEDGLIADTIKAKSEQKIEWSEEDELQMQGIIDLLPGLTIRHNWLKSLKDRVQPQPKQEWSEEDELRLNHIIQFLEDKDRWKDTERAFPIEEDVRWLKSVTLREVILAYIVLGVLLERYIGIW